MSDLHVTAELVNYQEQGWTPSPTEANRCIAAARQATPEHLRPLYRSAMHWIAPSHTGQGGYLWQWQLR